jgi:ABC-type amino acid transport system permease subunit
MGNSFVLLMLDTALVSTIGVLEITLRGYILAERSAASLEIFVGVAVIYLFFTAILGGILRTIESRFRVLR